MRSCADDQRDLLLDPGGVDLRRQALRVRQTDRLRFALHLVRYAVRISRRPKDVGGRGASNEVGRYGSPLVEVTGGEPLLQSDVYPLMERLLETGRTVLLETGGQVDVSRVPGAVVKVMDVKCPGSGESDKNDWGNIDRLGPRDQVKFVIKDRDDYEFARDLVTRHALDRRCAAVLFSPVHGVMIRGNSRSGFSRIGCRSGSSCRFTSTSGAPRSAVSNASCWTALR